MTDTSPSHPSEAPTVFRAGTLAYTRMGLVMVFFWLLWGMFVFMLMESLLPTLLPLLLKSHKATNAQLSFITTSLNVLGNLIFNPIVSFSSDRCRSRFGRRRPYIVFSTPFIVLSLALIPFGPDIAAYLQTIPWASAVISAVPLAPAILLIAVFVAMFQAFDTFVASTWYYLVRDCVPENMIGRFYGTFRLVGGIPGMIFNLLILPHGVALMKPIFVGMALFYGCAVLLMCWRVKEGTFPPPEPLPGDLRNPLLRAWGAIRLYFGDCFSHRLYWVYFTAGAMSTWAGAGGAFGILFSRDELGISLTHIGHIGAITQILGLAMAMPLGYAVDKYNFFRMTESGLIGRGIVALLGWFYVHDYPSLLVYSLVMAFVTGIYFAGLQKMQIAVFPKERYGQFGSANSAYASLGMIGLAVVAGQFVDWMGTYRSTLLWVGAFSFVASVLFIWTEKQWLRLGGWDNYKAP